MSAPVTRAACAREERAAVALAARDVENLATGDERRDEMIAMPVLVPDLAGGAGDEALAGEREFVVHGANSTRAQAAAARPHGDHDRTGGRKAESAAASIIS